MAFPVLLLAVDSLGDVVLFSIDCRLQDLGRQYRSDWHPAPRNRCREGRAFWRDHCWRRYGGPDGRGLGSRKEELSRRTIKFYQFSHIRSLHADSLAQRTTDRLRYGDWLWRALSSVPLQLAGQLSRAEAILGEHQAPGYGTQTCGMACISRNFQSVNLSLLNKITDSKSDR